MRKVNILFRIPESNILTHKKPRTKGAGLKNEIGCMFNLTTSQTASAIQAFVAGSVSDGDVSTIIAWRGIAHHAA